jgi:hypothetical protein
VSCHSSILGEKSVFSANFLTSTLREIFSPTRALVCHFAVKNATRSDKKEEVGSAP